jgi:hypothetical protein
MHFDALLETLPNGLHDAELVSLTLDLAAAEVHCIVDVDCSIPADPSSEGRSRRARLTFSGVSCFVVDPPESDPPTHLTTWIDAGSGVPQTSPSAAVRPPEGEFLAWIYRETVNSFVRIGARRASICWLDGGDPPT